MTFESGSYDAAFVAEAMRKCGAFWKRKKGKRKRPARRRRRASQTVPGRVFFFCITRRDRANRTQITVSDYCKRSSHEFSGTLRFLWKCCNLICNLRGRRKHAQSPRCPVSCENFFPAEIRIIERRRRRPSSENIKEVMADGFIRVICTLR